MKLKPYKCDSCPQTFSRMEDRRKHTRTVHLKIRAFKCDKCDKAYSAKPWLKHHVKMKHPSEGGDMKNQDNSSDPEDEELIN